MADEGAKTVAESAKPALLGLVTVRSQSLRLTLNKFFNYEPIFLIGGTAVIVHLLHHIYHSVPNDGAYEGLKRLVFKYLKKIPYVKKKVEEELNSVKDAIDHDMMKLMKGDSERCTFILQLPTAGLPAEDIVERLTEYMKLGNYTWQNGSVSGTVYHGGNELTKLNAKVYEMSAWTNPLHPDVFPGVCKMEAEIVQMVANLFHGDQDAVGTVTSGGTESILLAIKAYRDYAMEERGIKYPEIIVPKTAHAAFDKGAQLLGIKIKHVPVNPETCTVDVNAMRRMISKNTCMLVGSAPAYPHGCIDDIREIAKIGERYNIPVHVDACLGGFLIAFMPAAGFTLPDFDFRVPGVTSISADTHKYGFAPKGSSVLLFRNITYKHKQYFLQPNWPGGIYGSPTLAGSRPGAIIAGCWSSLLFFGFDGYVETTRRIVSTRVYIEKGLREIDGIYVMGKPQTSVVAMASKKFDVFRLADALNKKGWNLNNLQFPSSIHICLTFCHTEAGVADRFLKDVRTTVEFLMKDPSAAVTGSVSMYGSAQQIPDRSLVGEIAAFYLDSLYNTDCNKGLKKPILK